MSGDIIFFTGTYNAGRPVTHVGIYCGNGTMVHCGDPIQYTSIIVEHNAVLQHCGVFDVSHMGEITVTGNDAEKYVSHIFTNDIKDATVGKVYYGMMLYEDGGVVDDLLVYKMGENNFFLVINAANIDIDAKWINDNAKGYDVEITNR